MSYSFPKRKEMTRKDFERIQERHWRRIEPYFTKLQAEWILKEMDKQRKSTIRACDNLQTKSICLSLKK